MTTLEHTKVLAIHVTLFLDTAKNDEDEVAGPLLKVFQKKSGKREMISESTLASSSLQLV